MSTRTPVSSSPARAPTLDLVDLEVRRGRFHLGPVGARLGVGLWRVTGPNGAGKSTLLAAVAGELRPAAGAVLLDGGDVHRDAALRQRIGWAAVEPQLPDFVTAEEAWRMVEALRARRPAAHAPAQAGTAPGDPASSDPASAEGPPGSSSARLAALRLDPRVRLGACSAGMRRKAELVAALAGDPDVVLLDEPFASLDAEAVTVVQGWVAALRASRVVVLVHHGALGPALEGAVDGELHVGLGEPPPRPPTSPRGRP